MKNFDQKTGFINLRSLGYTYVEICGELHISKPTAIKWGKLYSEEISRVQNKLLTNMFAEKIAEQEYGLVISIKDIKMRAKNNSTGSIKITNRISQRLEKIFAKKIVAVQIIMRNQSDAIDRAIFIFKENAIVEKKITN